MFSSSDPLRRFLDILLVVESCSTSEMDCSESLSELSSVELLTVRVGTGRMGSIGISHSIQDPQMQAGEFISVDGVRFCLRAWLKPFGVFSSNLKI